MQDQYDAGYSERAALSTLRGVLRFEGILPPLVVALAPNPPRSFKAGLRRQWWDR